MTSGSPFQFQHDVELILEEALNVVSRFRIEMGHNGCSGKVLETFEGIAEYIELSRAELWLLAYQSGVEV